MFVVAALAGCTFAVHTPIVATSALGLDKESLADTQPYAGVINQDVHTRLFRHCHA